MFRTIYAPILLVCKDSHLPVYRNFPSLVFRDYSSLVHRVSPSLPFYRLYRRIQRLPSARLQRLPSLICRDFLSIVYIDFLSLVYIDTFPHQSIVRLSLTRLQWVFLLLVYSETLSHSSKEKLPFGPPLHSRLLGKSAGAKK